MIDNLSEDKNIVVYYKQRIDEAIRTHNKDMIVNSLIHLARVPMTIEILEETGIGRVVNNLRRFDDIAKLAKALVLHWKRIVRNFYVAKYYNLISDSSWEEVVIIISHEDNAEP